MTFHEFCFYIFLLIFAPGSPKTQEWRMLSLLNKDRRLHGLRPVRMQEDLRLVARRHSDDMAKKDYFDHVNLRSESPSDRLRIAGVTDTVSGENLAKIGGYSNPTQFAEDGLMKSPGHRANILNESYNVVGIGVVQDSRKVYYFTQNFAHRDIYFTKHFSTKVIKRHKFILRGRAFVRLHSLILRLSQGNNDAIVLDKVFRFQANSRDFVFGFDFPTTGNFKIQIYVNSEGGEKFLLSNTFQVKVYSSWWQKLLAR